MASRSKPSATKKSGKHSSLSRRQWLARAVAVGITASGAWLRAQPLAPQYEPLNRFPRMVHEWFVMQVRAAQQKNLAELERVQTPQQVRDYQHSVRERIRQCFGPEPPRTPLNARTVAVLERDAYRIEKIIFYSRPQFPVTANLYIPKTGQRPFPAVVGTCGHSAQGKAEAAYQSFAQGLARLGFVCLIYDPVSQGERLQYTREDLSSEVGPGVAEHLLEGNQQFLVGEFLGMWRAWDGIRALDYLLTRSEVDPARVGVTGNSGGGTLTTWLAGLESRWAMAAPSCFVTTFLHNLENELPADTEQCPPRALALHLDHADFLAVQAPKPVIILAKERDYFDVRGSEEAYQRLRRLWQVLGAEDRLAFFAGPTTHGYSQENREAMYAFFTRAVGLDFDRREPPLQLEQPEALWCTEKGQVASLPDSRTIFSFTAEKAEKLASERGHPRGAALRHRVQQLLRIPARDDRTPPYRIWRYLGSRSYPSRSAIAYAVSTEEGIFAVVYRLTDEPWYSRPPQSTQPAILYVSDLSSDRELRDEPWLREVFDAEPQAARYTCDVRGTGESQPDTCGYNSFLQPYGSDYFYAIHSLMLDRPYVGQKTWDVLRVIDWILSFGHTGVHLVARGRGTLPATFAALLHDGVRRVTLKHALLSYHAVACARRYSWPLSTFVPDVLSHFDLPDCYEELREKNLCLVDPLGAWDDRIR